MNFDIAKHNTFTSDYILKFQAPRIAKGGNSVPGVYCSNKTHRCHLELVNQFTIVFLSKVFPAVTGNRQDRGTDRTLPEPYDRHIHSCPFSQYCCCLVYWILFFRKQSTVHLFFYITSARNLIHISLYWWYKELFSCFLNNGVPAFYLFPK